MSFKIVKTSTTRLDKLPNFDKGKPKSIDEQELKKEDVALEESSVADAFEELFGEEGQEITPDEQKRSKPHVAKDGDIYDDNFVESEPPRQKYSGPQVDEDVTTSMDKPVEDNDLEDLITAAMNDEEEKNESENRPTSTPTKDDPIVDEKDFGGFISMIRDDSEPVQITEEKNDKERDVPAMKYTDIMPSEEPSKSSYSFSSKFVSNIPASFYKEIQAKLEDLIFRFGCLDNEYVALQKISHKICIDTADIKNSF